ncbi:Uncharacterised protein [Serratia proteamaculans]|uniref:hypothetical protein n=1 Tax=Serratia proteamaculans TaxID=28151 RepID=UPI0021780906|nr:hypothetical protein [Serratia proteamaculans]CAI0838908.1 Uncharacterised protein [Serratia proteamaculans]
MVSDHSLFTSGNGLTAPSADTCRQAVHALRGYAYQITAAALAWLDLSERATLFLEVAEDYATVLHGRLDAVQVKDTKASSTVTLNSKNVRDAIHNFVKLTLQNTGLQVHLEFFTSSEIAAERHASDNTFPIPGLRYWRQLAKGGNVTPLRKLLMSDKYSKDVREFVNERSDEELRTDMLQKIHWNCGKPDYDSLKNEFTERLIVIGKERFGLSVLDCEKIESMILNHVLQVSLGKRPELRMLRRVSLCRLIDDATRASIDKNTLDHLLKAQQKNEGLNSAPTTLAWITEVREMSDCVGLLPRTHLIREVQEKLAGAGICLIVGSSGVGKSHVAKYVAGYADKSYHIIDFRDIHGDEAASRMAVLISRIGAMNTQNIILEDFNCLQDPRLVANAAALFSALDRRDIKLILTCYEVPSSRTLSQTSIPLTSVIHCSYLTVEESNQLVILHGGKPELWGKIAHISGENGHPQLVHAFISGMAARGWPAPEIIEVLKNGLSSHDIQDERENIRRYVINGLPAAVREMLYRLSLITGSFTREAATSLGATPPPLNLPGELFDILKGPWIESLENNHFRISPLAAKSGKEVLTLAQQTSLHKDIANHYFKGGTGVDIQDIDKIITHAMAGKHEIILSALSFNLLTADEEIIQYLYNNVSVLRMLPLNTPAWPDNTTVSCALRITQFKIRILTRDKRQIQACWEALHFELKRASDDESSRYLNIVGLTAVLNTQGIANYLDDWSSLLIELHNLISQPSHPGMFDMFESDQMSSTDIVPLFFAVGIAGMLDVEKLSEIFQFLGALTPTLRMHLLQYYQEINPSFSVLVQTTWTEHTSEETWRHTVQTYRRLAQTSSQWNLPALTSQCWVAAAMMTAEKLHDIPASLRILEEASKASTDEMMLSLAHVRILGQKEEHAQVCEKMASLAKDAHKDNPVERVYLLRQAAISATKIDKWALAEEWFSLSQQAARDIPLDNMQIMAAGLTADTAVAALKAGNVKRSIEQVASALEQLEKIDHESSLNAYYCHQVTRHVVLWMLSVIEGVDVVVDNEPIVMIPGCCSNPTPPEAIRQKEHTPLMMAWYILAGLDIVVDSNIGLINKITPRFKNKYIIFLELELRKQLLMRAMLGLREDFFAKSAYDFITCWSYISILRKTSGFKPNPINPAWETIPPVGKEVTHDNIKMLDSILISYFIVAACKNHPVDLTALKDNIFCYFGETVAKSCLLSRLEKGRGTELQMLFCLVNIGQGDIRSPMHYCLTGIHALIQARKSYNRKELIPLIAQWQRYTWERLITWNKLNSPSIVSALNKKRNDEVFLSKLLIAAAKLTHVSIPDCMLSELEKLSNN